MEADKRMRLFQVGLSTNRWLIRALEERDVMPKLYHHIKYLFADGPPNTPAQQKELERMLSYAQQATIREIRFSDDGVVSA